MSGREARAYENSDEPHFEGGRVVMKLLWNLRYSK